MPLVPIILFILVQATFGVQYDKDHAKSGQEARREDGRR